MSDQDIIFPYTTNTISSKQVMRIKENINQEIIGWFNTKFSKLTPEKIVWLSVRKITKWDLKSERVDQFLWKLLFW